MDILGTTPITQGIVDATFGYLKDKFAEAIKDGRNCARLVEILRECATAHEDSAKFVAVLYATFGRQY